MTPEEIAARIITIEKEVKTLQLHLRELYLEIREGQGIDERVAEKYRS